MKSHPDTYPVIGMSPGNSYFKEEEIRYLLKTIVDRYGKTAVLVADVPAISTYVALGYPENRARRDKAIPQGNALKNRTDKVRQELGYSREQVRIVDWAAEVEENDLFREKYNAICSLYETNVDFQRAADETTEGVLTFSGRDIDDVQKATKTAVHYLLSEFAFLEFAPEFLGASKVSYVYHKNWPIYEDYIAGKFDGVERPMLDFILIENPYETYNPIWGFENGGDGKSVFETKLLRAAFTHNDPVLLYDRASKKFSGIFYEVLERIAQEEGWHIVWTEETGYGVIEDGLAGNRFDIFGSTVWPTPERERAALFSCSLFESLVYAWTREGSEYKSLTDIKNDPSARIAVKEGDVSDSIAATDFPDCRIVRVPQLSAVDSPIEFVANDKADVSFIDPYQASLFNKKSDRQVVRVDPPIRKYKNTFMVALENKALKTVLDQKISAYKEEGFITELIKKYTGDSGIFGELA